MQCKISSFIIFILHQNDSENFLNWNHFWKCHYRFRKYYITYWILRNLKNGKYRFKNKVFLSASFILFFRISLCLQSTDKETFMFIQVQPLDSLYICSKGTKHQWLESIKDSILALSINFAE